MLVWLVNWLLDREVGLVCQLRLKGSVYRSGLRHLFPGSDPAVGYCRQQKLKTRLLKNQRPKVVPFQPGAGPYIAMHATHTAREGNNWFYVHINH